MKGKFAANEIAELGVQIEKNGYDFYRILAAQSKTPRVKEVFKYLASQEQVHINTFQEILDKSTKNKPPEMLSDEYYSYMNSLASDYVFTEKDSGARLAGEITSEEHAVSLGIGFEKDSILFYDGMKQGVNPSERDVINELIAQEKNHLKQLYELKKTQVR